MAGKTHETALFERMAQLSRTPEQNVAHARALADSVQGLPVDQWPVDWTTDTVLSVAMLLRTPPDETVRFLRAKFPASFKES